MTPLDLSRTVLDAVRCAVDAGELSVELPERVVVDRPGPGGCGDFATNVALRLARPAGQTPLRVAEILRPRLAAAEGIEDVVVTGPGFLNISLAARDDLTAGIVGDILTRGTAYGHSRALDGQVVVLRVPYEVRAEVVADAVARIVATQGGRAEIAHLKPGDDHGTGESTGDLLRPLPAPEDPAPLGPDAAQWALLHPAAHDRPRISADHLVQRESNPLFRVRYAHARVRSLSRAAHLLGFTAEPGDTEAAERTTQTVQTAQNTLLTPLTAHPRILTAAATHHAPDRVARHLVTVADALFPLLPGVLPLGEEKPEAAHRARLALAEAAGTVLAGGLSLLGIDAPEHL
ncbi:ArgS-related anticodon-binding protein NrtL [Streptomyces sp. LaPpAH-108]|uniref:ArgS-related anticodon-binding protein NrtL n=1 Tax=Streptomyces sp. LaPpAH-108 TaxID=1155714 RepID=UPI00037718F8|nr:DALR anticodon-binding domain-containing protein [Streptomyces sp. LaPpAH-108]